MVDTIMLVFLIFLLFVIKKNMMKVIQHEICCDIYHKFYEKEVTLVINLYTGNCGGNNSGLYF